MIDNILKKIIFILKFLLRVKLYKTIKLNFSLLPFNQAIKLPLIIESKSIIDSLKGKVIFNCPITFGLLIIGKDGDNMPITTNKVRITIDGVLVLNGKSMISSGSTFIIYKNGRLELGKYSRILSGVFIKATYKINIGNYSRLTSGTFIQDSNIHPIKEIDTGKVNRFIRPIIIGNNCWIGMNSTILGGTILPDFSIGGRNAFFNKDYSGQGIGLLLVGSPAKIIKQNLQRLYNMSDELEITDYFLNNPDVDIYNSYPGLEVIDENDMDRFFRI